MAAKVSQLLQGGLRYGVDLKTSAASIEPGMLVTLEPTKGYQIDNFEGIAHHRGKRFFLISDDNDFFLQRTLLLYIELVD